jgi:hypothetical protein
MGNLVDGDGLVNEVADIGLRRILDLVWLLRWLVGSAAAVRRWWHDWLRRRRLGRGPRQHRRLAADAC